jgi:photosystem II stability/assembly factor-like uncharacterized protein
MNRKNLFVFILMIGIGYSFYHLNELSILNRPFAKKSTTIYDKNYEKLLELQKRFSANSPQGIRVAEQIKKMKRLIDGYVKSDQPDEFVRILNEMKIPYGESYSSYPSNYRNIELEKAKRVSLNKISNTPLPWIERGPGNVSGRVRGLIVDPDDLTGNTWFIGSVGGGIWKTTDAGNNWIDLAPDLPSLAVSTLAMANSNHNIIYAGTGESMYSVDVINGNGIYKSTDKGETWFHLRGTIGSLDFNNISRIIVDPNNPNIVLASTSSGRYRMAFANKSGIFKSTDGGNSWKEVYDEPMIGDFGRVKKVLQLVETPANFNVLYAAVDEKGILKSTDAGETWFKSSDGIQDSSGRFEIAISPTNPSKIYAAAEGSPTSNLFVSTDAGQTWVKTLENGTEPNWLSSQGWYDNTITVHPTDENIVFVGGVYLFQINLLPGNQRQTIDLETGPVHVDHHNLVIIPGTGGSFRILNANDGGIGLASNGAGNWSKPTNGLNTTQFYGVDKMPGGSAYVGGMQDNGTWRSPENPERDSYWFYQIGGDGYETSWHFDDPDKIIGGYQYNGLQRSADGGQTWNSATSGLTNIGSGNAPFITKIAKTNQEPDLLFAVGKSGVFRSTNFGLSWVLTPIQAGDWGSISSFHDVKISRANPNIVWAGSRMDPSGKISVSTNKGTTFTAATVYNTVTMGGISGIATHPIQDSTAYILFSFSQKPKILRTTNLGQTWEDISGFETNTVSTNGFPDVAIYDLLVMPHQPNTIWVGTEIGLFESTDNGQSWHMANNGLPALPIWDMTHVEDEVILGTHGRGVWSVKIPGLGDAGRYKPLLKNLTQGPDGAVSINIRLRSLYDSSIVHVNSNRYAFIGANSTSNLDTLLKYPILVPQNVSVTVTSYIEGTSYESVTKNINAILVSPAQNSYVNNFNSLQGDFTGTGFEIKLQSGFESAAIHSIHPYSDNTNNTFILTVPIIVASSNAFLSYKDVAIIEPGDPGSVFGDENFWDFVIVEGTKDGMNWIPLADGYDCRHDPKWLSTFNASTSGNSTMFRSHEINLLSTFNADDQIFIRFRLFADAYVTGWGWAIDDLEIQGRLVGVEDENNKIPSTFSLSQNYPNPFNPSTKIRYTIAPPNLPRGEALEKVTLKMFDLLGKEVATLVNEVKQPGIYEVAFDASELASAVYYYRLQAGDFTQTRKMILLR